MVHMMDNNDEEGGEHVFIEDVKEVGKDGEGADVARLPRTVVEEVGESSSSLRNALLSHGDDIDLVAPESKWETSRNELWSFYAYYVGNSGLGPYNFAPIALQNLLTLAAASSDCGADGQPECRLAFAGSMRNVNSIVLLLNGISFAIQAFILLTVGSAADFGRGRPWILIVATVISLGVGFGWLGVTHADQWKSAAALYVIGLVGYQVALTFWSAAFVGLARNLPIVRESARKLASSPPETTAESHHSLDVMQRNRVSNVAFFVCSAGELVVLAVIQGMLAGVDANRDTETNTRALTYVVAFATGVWLLCAVPWFVLEKHRPGLKMPPGMNVVTAGVLNAWEALRNIWTLKQSLIYLVFYFLMNDALSTTVTQISIVQASLVSYSSTTSNLLLIVGIAAQAAGIGIYWLLQRRFGFHTFTMLRVVCFFIVLMAAWGMVGNWSAHFGFRNKWETFAYQAYYGLFACSWYALSITGISEVAPRGLEFQFFCLMNLTGKSASFIGPFVTSAISNASAAGNSESTPFYFLFALALFSCIFLIPLDGRKARIEQAAFLARRKRV
ncbi:unnamed protein product [Parajaminaea phylloscopi]